MKKRSVNKGLVVLLAVLVLAISVVGCGGGTPVATPAPPVETPSDAAQPPEQPQEPEVDFPTRPINIIVSFAAGGATDVGARILTPVLSDVLGVPVHVTNVEGGGGWVGWNELMRANPDGYTIGYVNTPHVFTYLNPELNRGDVTFESFELLANHVIDFGVIAIRPDDPRFHDLDSLIAYSLENELLAATTAAGSDDHIAVLKFNRLTGGNLVPVNFASIAEARASFLGDHVDLVFGKIGAFYVDHQEGEANILAIFAPERSELAPSIPTAVEQGLEVFSWSSRGFIAPLGMDPQIKEIIVAALEASITNPEVVQRMSELALAVVFMSGEEYWQFLFEEEQGIKSVLDLLGWE